MVKRQYPSTEEIIAKYREIGNIHKTAKFFHMDVKLVREAVPKEIKNPHEPVTEEQKQRFLQLLRDGDTIAGAGRKIGHPERSTLAYQFQNTPEWQAAHDRWENKMLEITPSQQRHIDAAARHHQRDLEREKAQERAVWLYDQNLTIGLIAKHLGSNSTSVGLWIKASGRPLAPRSGGYGKKLHRYIGDTTELTDAQLVKKVKRFLKKEQV